MFIPGVTAGGHKYPPVVSTNTITPSSTEYDQLTFSGQIVRAGNSDNTVVFHYSVFSDLSTYNTTSPAINVANGTYSLDVFFTQPGLNPTNAGTTYYYRIVSTNSVGATTIGDIKSATVPVRPPTVTTATGNDATVVPTATTNTQSNANATSATLNGTATNATSCHFQYSTNAGMTGATTTGNTASQTSPSIGISSLSPGTDYFYRLVSSNALTRATFNGTVNPQNRDTNTIFRYATTPTGVAGSPLFVSGPNPVTNTTTQNVSVTLSLATGTYYYRLEATNAGGTSGTEISNTIKSVTIEPKFAPPSSVLSFKTYSLRSQTFNSSGTWVRPSAPTGYAPITSAYVYALGGGGGGARGLENDSFWGAVGGGAGGGGGGQISAGFISVSGNVAVTVGDGGTKASVANGSYAGQAGGTSSAGAISAAGGQGGKSNATFPNGGAAGNGYAGGSGSVDAYSAYSLGGGGGGQTGSGGNAGTTTAGVGGSGSHPSWAGGGGGAGWWYNVDTYLLVYVAGTGTHGGTNGAQGSASNAAANSGGGGGGSIQGSGGQGGSGYVYIEWYGP